MSPVSSMKSLRDVTSVSRLGDDRWCRADVACLVLFSLNSLRDVTDVSYPWDVRAFCALLLTGARRKTFVASKLPRREKRTARFVSDRSRRILFSNVRNTAECRRGSSSGSPREVAEFRKFAPETRR